MRDQIVENMTRNNFFSSFQHGKSCVTQFLEYLEELTEALHKGKDVDIIYQDFQKRLISYA